MIDVLSNKISGCVIWFYFTMFFVNIGKNPGNKVLSAVELTPGILRAAMQALFFGGKDEGRRDKYRTIDITP